MPTDSPMTDTHNLAVALTRETPNLLCRLLRGSARHTRPLQPIERHAISFSHQQLPEAWRASPLPLQPGLGWQSLWEACSRCPPSRREAQGGRGMLTVLTVTLDRHHGRRRRGMAAALRAVAAKGIAGRSSIHRLHVGSPVRSLWHCPYKLLPCVTYFIPISDDPPQPHIFSDLLFCLFLPSPRDLIYSSSIVGCSVVSRHVTI